MDSTTLAWIGVYFSFIMAIYHPENCCYIISNYLSSLVLLLANSASGFIITKGRYLVYCPFGGIFKLKLQGLNALCLLLQVRKKVKGFFRRYPDAQTAYIADPERMAEYLAPLGLQRVKAKRIQKFSIAYLQEEWTYVTELYGVGK